MSKKEVSNRLYESSVINYFRYWSISVKDATDIRTNRDATDIRTNRVRDYFSLTKSYYNMMAGFMELTLGSSFHTSSLKNGETIKEASRRHEHELAKSAGIRENDFVLDVGSGIGGPAREIARVTGSRILGINFDEHQLERAHRYTVKDGLSDRVEFVKGDFMNMPFIDASFDSAYSIEGTSYAPNLKGVYSEIFRVLKPGGRFAAYELIMTDKFDESSPHHCKLREILERGMGLSNLTTMSAAVDALENVGFEVEIAEDLSTRYTDIPWYYPIGLSFKWLYSLRDTIQWNLLTTMTRSVLAQGVGLYLIKAGESLGLLPPRTNFMITNMAHLNVALVNAGKEGIFTPLFMIVARKPSKHNRPVSRG